jgi:pilus assembly protein CpaF
MPDPLDTLAVRLRDQLLRDAADPDTAADGDLTAQIRALVDREAAMLGPDARAELARRVAEKSFGLGPLEPLLADPDVDEVVVNGA